jgi:glutathione peroxidase
MTLFDFNMKTINGKDKALSDYRGKTILIVNVASKCGFTPQYKGLEELYQTFKSKGLVILGFPANEFGSQEPGTDSEITQFCEVNFGVSFPMFSKIVVKGEGIDPLYQFLTSPESNKDAPGAVKWNFQKYLINKDGYIVKTFSPKTEPLDADLINEIEHLL